MTTDTMTSSQTGRNSVRIGLIALIGALLIILAVLLLNLLPLMIDTRERSVATSRRGVESKIPMPEAEARARTRAQVWTSDLHLIRAEATWYPDENWQNVDNPPVAWSFYYYSPSEKSVGVATIDDEKVLWVPPFATPSVPSAIGDFPPAFGVEACWLNLLAVGSEEFLEAHPHAQVSFRLQPQGERLTWTVSALDEGDSLRILVDAQTGIIVNQE
jgi:hypothetical protein